MSNLTISSMIEIHNAQVGSLQKSDGYNCDICHNKGIVYILDDVGNEAIKDCECKKVRKSIHRLKESGLQDKITDFTFNNYICTSSWQRQLKSKAEKYAKDEKACVFAAFGQSGAGKTHICTAIANELIKAGKDVKYMLWVEEATRLKAIAKDSVEYNKRLEELKTTDVLYIDDFFKNGNLEKPSSADIKLAFDIVDRRTAKKLKTIISTELYPNELLTVDQATAGRLFQKAGVKGEYMIPIKRDTQNNYRLKSIGVI